MQVCLISPPTVTDFEDPAVAEDDAIRLIAEHAPVGILSLAAVLEGNGIVPHVVDLNQLYYDHLRSDEYAQGEHDFCAYVARHFEPLSFDVFGLSTICSSYPLTLRIARAIKRAHPHTTTILGGPQASVVDVQTMTAFPHIDFIVRGEAEETFPVLLSALSTPNTWDDIPGVTFRRRNQVIRTPNAPVIADMDRLPLPAFHLYPQLKSCRYVPLELGRGCPFACTFCSTNDFFRRNFRLKSPEKLIAEMKHIRETYEIATFDLIHDMFTVDRKKVVEFCTALLRSGEKFHWNCSARTDCIDEELIALMARAGCRGIFFGIETGSARMQRLINKKLDLAEAARMIKTNNRHKITTAVSLITAFPDETNDDLKDTVAFFADSLRYDYAEPQFHLLAPLAETPISTFYREQLILDDIVSDMSYQGWRQNPEDRAMIAAHRDIFPNFYSAPTPLDRQHLKELRDFLLNGTQRFRWLLVALDQDSGDLLKVFDEWRAWRQERRGDGAESNADLSIYYSGTEFNEDLLEFVRSHYRRTLSRTPEVISAIVEYEAALSEALEDGQLDANQSAMPPTNGTNGKLGPETVPQLMNGVHVMRLSADYKKIIECLRRKGRLNRVPTRPVTLVTRLTGDKRMEIVQLSRHSTELLNLCDGKRTVKQIAKGFSSLAGDFDGIPADKACLFGLELLCQQGLIVTAQATIYSGFQMDVQ